MKFYRMWDYEEKDGYKFATVEFKPTWFKGKVDTKVYRPVMSSYWRFLSTGEWIGSREVAELEEAQLAVQVFHR